MINEKQVRYLLTVSETGNITAAAQKLFITQPALSRMILDLERSLGTALFVRDRGNLHLSQAGEVYLRGCRDVMATQNAVIKKIADLRDSRIGRLTLGITALTGEYILPLILNDFSEKYPNVELALTESRMEQLYELVRSGKADLAITYQREDPVLEFSPALEDPVFIQVPPGFWAEYPGPRTAAEHMVLPPEFLDGKTMILLKKGRGLRKIADQMFEHFQIQPGKIIETDNIHLAKSLVRMNRGFTLVPEIATRNGSHHAQGDDRYCEIKDYPIRRKLCCCYRKGGYLTEAENYMIQSLPILLKP